MVRPARSSIDLMFGFFVTSTARDRFATKYGIVKSTVRLRLSLIVMAETPMSNCPVGSEEVNRPSKLVVVDFAVSFSRFATSL